MVSVVRPATHDSTPRCLRKQRINRRRPGPRSSGLKSIRIASVSRPGPLAKSVKRVAPVVALHQVDSPNAVRAHAGLRR